MMKRTISLLILSIVVLASCKENRDILIPYPEDITFEDQTLADFKFKIPDAPFKSGNEKSGVATFNVKNNGDGTFSGFAVSNKNWRSFPWNLSPDFPPTGGLTPQKIKESIDSCIFSVYTTTPNQTNNYLVASVKDEDAAITLDKPSIIEHILVANTTYNYLLETYGSVYSGTLNATTQEYSITGTKVKNIQIANPSTLRYGRFTLPGPNNSNLIRLAGDEILARNAAGDPNLAKGYVKLTIKGYNGATTTGTVDKWLAIRPNVDPQNPTFSFVASDWAKVNLSTLGTVTRIVFLLSSSYTDGAGNMLYPSYFCLDGIRIRK